MSVFNVSLAQLCSSDSVQGNLSTLLELIARASAGGSQVVVFPENSFFMGPPTHVASAAEEIFRKRYVRTISAAADQAKIHVVLGGVQEYVPGHAKVFNTTFWISDRGRVVARYRKIHLFDVSLPSGQAYSESRVFAPGEKNVLVRHGEWKIGLSICYDLRFPSHYQTLRRRGAHVFFVPSAFTEETGKAHWHTLLRARAIENHAYVLAPAQGGTHPHGRVTYGHSLAVDPWGTVLLDAEHQPGLHSVTLDMDRITSVRAVFGASATKTSSSLRTILR